MDNQLLIKLQIEEMARHKWIESEKVGYDLGETALFQWIELHLDGFLQHIQA